MGKKQDKKDKKDKKSKKEEQDGGAGQLKMLPLDYMPQISNVVSATECTGLVPTQPQDRDELENRMSLFSNSLPPVWNDQDLSQGR